MTGLGPPITQEFMRGSPADVGENIFEGISQQQPDRSGLMMANDGALSGRVDGDDNRSYPVPGGDEMAAAKAEAPCIAAWWYVARVLLNVMFASNSSVTFGFRLSWCFA